MRRNALNINGMQAGNPLQPRGPRPGDYALGSVESRAAARAMLERALNITSVLIFTGLPGDSATEKVTANYLRSTAAS